MAGIEARWRVESIFTNESYVQYDKNRTF